MWCAASNSSVLDSNHEYMCRLTVAHMTWLCVFTTLSFAMIFFLNFRLSKHSKRRHWVQYPLHRVLWLVSFALVVLSVFDVVEGLLSQFYYYSDVSLHLYLPKLFFILGICASLYLYNFTEKFNKHYYVMVYMSFWGIEALISLLNVWGLMDFQNSWQQMTFWLAAVKSAMCLLIFVTCVISFFFELWKRRHNNGSRPAEELQNLSYIHPYVNLLSRVTWNWSNSLFVKGYRQTLTLEDLGRIPQDNHSKGNYKMLKAIFAKEKEAAASSGRRPSLLRCYLSAYWKDLALAGLLKLTADQLAFVPPVCLDIAVNFVTRTMENNTSSVLVDSSAMSVSEFFSNGYVMVLIAFCCCLLAAFCSSNHFFLGVRQGIRSKAALQSMVFDKTLRLSTSELSEGEATAGQVMNHMSVDPLNVFYLFYIGNFIWTMPFQILTGITLLYIQLGRVALVSSVVIVVMVPVQYSIGRILGHFQKKALEMADQRLKRTHEMLNSIKFIKLCAWEGIFSRAVQKVRKSELVFLLKAACCRIVSILVTDVVPLLATILTFVLYPKIEGKPLPPGKAFSALALFNLIGIPLYCATLVINIVTHAVVSTRRLEKFLLSDEVESADNSKDVSQVEVHFSKTNGDLKVDKSAICVSEDLTEPGMPPSIDDPLLTLSVEVKGTNHSQGQTHSSRLNGIMSDPVVSPSHTNEELRKCISDPCQKQSSEFVVQVDNATFSWDAEKANHVLKDINLKIPRGKLTMVIGSVGCGKSSLLSAVLGEMFTVSGAVHWNKELEISYVAQKAWLLNATLQENILFGQTLDEEKYNEILDVCALRPDLELLSAGDQTEIGEKGVNLSGGQKQRVALARGLYSDADVMLMDDPLSALDAHVGQKVFSHAILSYLVDRQHRTVVLVTHHLHYLDHASWVVNMEEGVITHQGRYDQVKGHIKHDIKPAAEENGPVTPKDKLRVPPLATRSNSSELRVELLGRSQMRSALSTQSLATPSLYDEIETDQNKKVAPSGQLIEEEEMEHGSVAIKYYMQYARAAGWFLVLLTLTCFISRQAFRMVGDFFLSDWIEVMKMIDLQLTNQTNQSTFQLGDFEDDFHHKMWAYIGVQILIVLLIFGSIFSLEVMALSAAKTLHSKMLKCILNAPMRFFDTTPLGRIINRFTGDTNVIDEKIVVTYDQLFYCALFVLGSIVVNVVSTPVFLALIIPMLLAFVAIQRFYIASSRELQRLDNTTKSPVLSLFSQTLSGLTTIRAYRAQERFQKQHWDRIDVNNTAFLYLHTAHSWMSLRLDILGACFVLASGLCSVTTGILGYISPSVVGLALAYAVVSSTALTWTLRASSELEMWFNSVERVDHYTSLQTEHHDREDVDPPQSWPSEGRIEFKNMSVTYEASLPPVLTDVNLTIPAGQKVGVCGRTGSGKSSLMISLFRLIHVSSGQILIDGIDIASVPLPRLRNQLSIIPQDPVLFSGTIRENLDPLKGKTDEELWHALDIAQLKNLIKDLPQQLDTLVAEGGENLSIGQRQLFCLARAFLRNSCILVMDEATSSIDPLTDQAIQAVIQTAFAVKTVITVAHRVNTIMHCDVILVLHEGKVVEQGSPETLLQRQDSLFAGMVKHNRF